MPAAEPLGAAAGSHGVGSGGDCPGVFAPPGERGDRAEGHGGHCRIQNRKPWPIRTAAPRRVGADGPRRPRAAGAPGPPQHPAALLPAHRLRWAGRLRRRTSGSGSCAGPRGAGWTRRITQRGLSPVCAEQAGVGSHHRVETGRSLQWPWAGGASVGSAGCQALTRGRHVGNRSIADRGRVLTRGRG